MPSQEFVAYPVERATAYRSAGYFAGLPLDTILTDAARRRPRHRAVLDDTTALTYAELDAAADRLAAGLAGAGITPGDRVLLQLPNGCRFVVALFALLRAGAVPVLCLPGHRRADLAHFLEVSGATTLVIADTAGGFDYRAMATQLVEDRPGLRVIVAGDAGPFLPWEELDAASAAARRPPIDPQQPALLLASGGTTGAPKLIPRTHDDYRYNVTASAGVCALSCDDVYLAVLPAAHNFALACPGLLGALSVGATVVFTTDPSPESAFATITRHGVTVTALVPTLATLWAQACEWEPVTPDTLRLLQVGGAKLGPDEARLLRDALGTEVQQVFGMAEGLLCYTRPGDAAELVEHTQGRPLCVDDELLVVGDDGTPAEPGVEGELWVRGPYTINGYYNAEAVNKRAFNPDGFFRSGDQVRLRQDGYLEVTGRIKDVIQRAGETVAAEELEVHLLAHPAISAAAAVGLPDPYLGEQICAAVVFHADPLTLTQLHHHLEGRGVAAHARPDTVVAMAALPTTAVGKVDKKAIVRLISVDTEPAGDR
ncbi:AMP-binding protein [Mycolicibacillus parakoreensis]|uniref:AMP-binding protein n=1 Tax=Mycolicibacillus parakoreensis TaxID=1069221 RepID=A0ABY3U1P3_9MYCO|nr:AMP-binding protein [Mycolicibacillus parakoreensis]MCV7314890.1 AMP-binding protein [Mycolicibacillus parakoreensis]ULN53884.1 AMP-binding protein [Mycolicibacillus parakoreensis]